MLKYMRLSYTSLTNMNLKRFSAYYFIYIRLSEFGIKSSFTAALNFLFATSKTEAQILH